MTSGKPLSNAEKKLIAQYPNEWPAVLARHLAMHYREDNGGSRSAATVRRYQAELAAQETAPEEPNPAPKRARNQATVSPKKGTNLNRHK